MTPKSSKSHKTFWMRLALPKTVSRCQIRFIDGIMHLGQRRPATIVFMADLAGLNERHAR